MVHMTHTGPMTVGRICQLAAERIEQHGWCKGSFRSGPHMCGWAAILFIAKGDEFEDCLSDTDTINLVAEVHVRLKEVSSSYTAISRYQEVNNQSCNVHCIPTWNDRPERRMTDVIEAFRAVYQREREQQIIGIEQAARAARPGAPLAEAFIDVDGQPAPVEDTRELILA